MGLLPSSASDTLSLPGVRLQWDEKDYAPRRCRRELIGTDSGRAMYWPIGAPRAYALSTHATAPATTSASNDGLGESGASRAAPKHGNSDVGDDGKTVTQGEIRNGAHNGEPATESAGSEILSAKLSRSGSHFTTITRSSLTIWQAKPTVALASIVRSPQSLEAYGPTCALLLRPDALVVVVQTTLGYLITYGVTTDPQALVYRTQLPETHRHARRGSTADGYTARTATADAGPGEGGGIREISLRFRMVIRIDAGISCALALDDELVVATRKPVALQCIRWAAEEGTPQTSTELTSRMPWYGNAEAIVEMVHDRPMNLMCWISGSGHAYAVQRRPRSTEANGTRPLFQGYCFRAPDLTVEGDESIKVAINARFSLIAVGLANSHVDVYTVKDYNGNVPFSHGHQSQATSSMTGQITHLAYSPDGHCLFVGYESGWTMWSVYGKLLASSLGVDRSLSKPNDETWLHGVRSAFWLGGGCELALLAAHDDRIWLLEMARSAGSTCLTTPNITRGLLVGSTTVTFYRGHDVQDVTAVPEGVGLWQTVQVPNSYLADQWPIKLSAVSPDSKYIAVAGRRGLAHYSVASGRWRTFEDPSVEDGFAVRGGMTWWKHFLIVAVEAGSQYSLRVYSREKPLERVVCEEELSHPAILTTTSGTDSLLVYTYENVLLHYIIAPSGSAVRLVQVGQIGFHGIIRAPPRVRAISWLLPEDQVEHGDPSQDVATASVLFLVDGKLVLLQPSTNEQGELKYDMRVIAPNVEYYILFRDTPDALTASDESDHAPGAAALSHSLRDSLWFFDGEAYRVWTDITDVLACAPAELGRELPPTVTVPLDFFPLSVLVHTGIAHGLDSELVQRRDLHFALFRPQPRTQLFLPHLLRHHLAEYNAPAALHLAEAYAHLPYFAHALEVLLHDVLDAEVDDPPMPPETALLPTVVGFLYSFPAFLDVVVNCTRKTELRSWRTLFACLPPIQTLFERSLDLGKLKTAAGYLLVLHAFDDAREGAAGTGTQTRAFARLLGRAVAAGEWELCAELARFLVGIDAGGGTLRAVLGEAGLGDGLDEGRAAEEEAPGRGGTANGLGRRSSSRGSGARSLVAISSETTTPSESGGDYFHMGA
ncbi:WD40 repeat protein [Teratosphaeriaceae sp. CCFEE 6253]|nr:WD40 repeat protein [Teratosphaeriaceae sp. CCFEE 6253]